MSEPNGTTIDPNRIPRTALLLGLGGVIPFLALSILMALVSEPLIKFLVGRSLIAYAAVILSFLGGARWGLALRCTDRKRQGLQFIASVLPSIAAWLLLTARLDTAIAAYALLFAILGLFDAVTLDALDSPAWYKRLRTLLSGLVVSVLVGAMFAL